MTITINGSGTITGATTLASTVASPTMTTPTLTTPTMTGAIVSSMGSSVITSGTAVASTSGTSIDFTSIPSWVKRITVMYRNVSTNGTSNHIIQIGSGSFTTSGYIGACGYTNATSASTGNFTTGFGVTFAVGASSSISGVITITHLGSNLWASAGVVGLTTDPNVNSGAGSVSLGGTLDRVRITTVAGTDTFDLGTVNILYE